MTHNPSQYTLVRLKGLGVGMICKIRGCEEKSSGRRSALMCWPHYKELGRNGGLTECWVPDCESEAHREGFCLYHWRNLRQYNSPIRPRWHGPMRGCAFPSCDREQATRYKDLCETHENQKWRGVELTPIRPQRPKNEAKQDWIECKTCGELKPRDMYYFRPRAQGPSLAHRRCKDCIMEAQRKRKGVSPKGWGKYGHNNG